jgi:pterin-4a-carbinolamine dehydratase
MATYGRAVPERARQVRTFEAGLELFRRIAAVAEAEGHHPDLHLEGYNRAYAQLSTHSVGARRAWRADELSLMCGHILV